MAPPGGKTQINLFGSEEPAPMTPVNPNQKKRNDSSIFEQAPATCNNNNNSVNAPVKTDAVEPAVESQNGAAAPGGGKPSTKVIAPPGGRSSINLFG